MVLTHRSLRVLVLATIAGLTTACSALATDPAGVPADATPVPFTRLEASAPSGAYTGSGSRERRLVRDAQEWSVVWAELVTSRTPIPPVPVVDFTTHSIVLVAMSTQGTGGYAIEVQAVAATNDRLYVEVLSRSPGPRCGVTLAATRPFDLVLIPRHVGPVQFVERARVTDCP